MVTENALILDYIRVIFIDLGAQIDET